MPWLWNLSGEQWAGWKTLVLLNGMFSTAISFALFWLQSLIIGHSHRLGLYEDLCHIHKNGVEHGDLRPSNITILDDSKPHFIDFSHPNLHDCKEPESCEELIEAYDILLLPKT